jgi:hypothetical protein
MKMSPFYANYGFHPRLISEIQVPSEYVASAAADFIMHLHDIHNRLVENIKAV